MTATTLARTDRCVTPRARGVRTLVGLQGRYSPVVRYVQDLIRDGTIGRLWSVNFARANDQTAQMDVTPEYHRFLETANAGLRIQAGHALDTLTAYAGELRDLQAYMETEMDRIRVTTGEVLPLTHKDHILVQGRLLGDAVVSALFKQNSPTYKPFHLEISGSSGALVVTAGAELGRDVRHPGTPSEFELFGTSALGTHFVP